MDDCWFLDVEVAFGEPREGVFVVLGGGLRDSSELRLCTRQSQWKQVLSPSSSPASETQLSQPLT